MFIGSAGPGKGSVRIVPLGGTGDVTKNMFVYEYCYDGKLKDILLVDCGIGFPDPDMYGVDLVIPDVRYLMNKKEMIRGLVFTHGHDDHIGAIPYIYPKLGKIPMWATPLTAAFANVKLKEIKIKEKVTTVGFDKEIQIGPFRVSFVRMTHSVPDTANLIIETPVGIFYHGSDFKFDFNPLDGKLSEIEKINAVGKKGVLCLLTDCLGSERSGFTPSEQKIGDVLEHEIALCPGKFLFTTQSSNISRIQRAIEIALRSGRQIAFIGRSVNKNVEAALDLGYMRFPRDKVVRDRDLRKVPAIKQFLVVAGAQGQPESALVRVANDNHSFVSLNAGDTVLFSADPIPGNENAVNDVIDQIYRTGARVSYTTIMEDLHVSGHGSQGDHMLLLSALGPQYVFPIGGTARHIVNYRTVASEIGFSKNNLLVPEEGEILEFKKFQKPRVAETISLENILVDGLGVGDVGAIVLHDRQTIAQEGIVVVVVPIDRKSGRIIGEPDIISRGFVYIKESTALLERAKRLVIGCLKTKKNRIRDWRYIRELVEDNLQQFLRKETGRQPLIVPVVLEV
ncbi:MAG: RNA-metabolising metallo-beta-lactamase [Candidatus Gottesmanbacteria bacterium GW2011_GWA2_44_17]|uniref:Ribonuclease J n=2 Tax=Candidatus Gottesmaniibacteriota TaxID=1752720 RepID=A0A0G1KHJ2_9BACT|nr:MAG: RNA-metabolising metallo-beta-lactamase [Microgenomates group bacterium GW2011_GWC1_43_11]KKT47339.1 MAG: RNA-metabolising metallo-beta-lactamase [Candidatus Gottesmanbacteria bacterium GW2011_GWA2_44_17]